MTMQKKQGGWVPIHKGLVSELPKGREYTKLEAAFSLTVDYDNGKPVTVAGLAKRWNWSRGKVERFLHKAGAVISYPENTGSKQNQRGQIVLQIPSRNRADAEQILFIDSQWLREDTGRKRTDNEQKAGRSQGATLEPKPNPNPEPIKKQSCGELRNSPPPPSPPVVMIVTDEGDPVVLLPLVDKTEYPVFQNQVTEFEAAYPAVDVTGQLRKMRAWLIANPRQRKTRAGIMRFANTWLAKEQDRGGTGGGNTLRGQARTAANMDAARGVLSRMTKGAAIAERNRLAAIDFIGDYQQEGE